jgi:cystathionine beta-lyase/cystathionine gamma-synthase
MTSFETLAIHAGQKPDPSTGAVMTPIYQTSTYRQEAVGETKGYEYSRTGNPTRDSLEKCVAALEGGSAGLAFSSGMAAIDAVLRLISPGDHVLAINDLYGGTFRLFNDVYAQYGIECSYAAAQNTGEFLAQIRPETRLIWLETPTNPLMGLCDLEAIAEGASGQQIWIAVDNTFASPYLQRPLQLGADIVVHSTTKYLGGHSDLVGGVLIVKDRELAERLAFIQNAAGAIPGPFDCFLTLRGIKTLPVRMDRHCENASALAQFLDEHEAVSRVLYPGLASHPQHELASRQMHKPGGMLSFALVGGEEAARHAVENTKVFTLAESLGSVESLIEIPALMTHMSTMGSPLEIDPGLIRLSVGLEGVDDLIQDLDQAIG